MYRVNREQNNITKLEECKFSVLQFRERENLQEWIAKTVLPVNYIKCISSKMFSIVLKMR